MHLILFFYIMENSIRLFYVFLFRLFNWWRVCKWVWIRWIKIKLWKKNRKIENNWEIFRHLDDLLQPWDATARSINDATIQKPFGFNNKSWLLWTMANYSNWTCVNQIIVTVLEYGSSSIYLVGCILMTNVCVDYSFAWEVGIRTIPHHNEFSANHK